MPCWRSATSAKSSEFPDRRRRFGNVSLTIDAKFFTGQTRADDLLRRRQRPEQYNLRQFYGDQLDAYQRQCGLRQRRRRHGVIPECRQSHGRRQQRRRADSSIRAARFRERLRRRSRRRISLSSTAGIPIRPRRSIRRSSPQYKHDYARRVYADNYTNLEPVQNTDIGDPTEVTFNVTQ